MSGEFPQIDNGSGPKKTIYEDNNLRYDREKPCRSYGHPRDNFQNYSIQMLSIPICIIWLKTATERIGSSPLPPRTHSLLLEEVLPPTSIYIQQNSGRIPPQKKWSGPLTIPLRMANQFTLLATTATCLICLDGCVRLVQFIIQILIMIMVVSPTERFPSIANYILSAIHSTII